MKQSRDQQQWAAGTKGGGMLPRSQGHQEESGTIEMWALLEEMLEEDRE